MKGVDPNVRMAVAMLAGALLGVGFVLLLSVCADRTKAVRALREFPRIEVAKR